MPTQAVNTSTGNWRARYKSEFYDARGRHWRVELIDSDTASGHTGFGISSSTILDTELTSDGFNLSWDGPTDHVGGSIIPSSCEVTWIVNTSQMENLKSVIKGANDARLGIALYYDNGGTHWSPYWVGCLNHEAIVYETQDRPYMVTLVANCGLNRLSNVEFRNSGSVYTDDASIAEVFARCINKIPTATFWSNSDIQMREVVDCFSKDHFSGTYSSFASSEGDAFPISVIERTVVNSLTFSDGGDVDEDEYGRRIKQPPNFNSCKNVLENIANAFGARITMARSSFWFFPANALNWSHTLRVQSWFRSQVSSETIQTQLVGGIFNGDTSTYSDVNFRHDIDANHALGIGWSNSYLLPIKRCTLTFEDAGTKSVLGPPRNFYLDYPNNGSGVVTFGNPDLVVSEGEILTLSGTYSTDLVREFGSALLGNGFNLGTDRIGARILLRFKIKINSASGTPYYYGSEYSVDSETTHIDMPLGYNGDLTDPNINFHRIFLDTPSWSTNEKFFDVIVPWTSSTPPAEVESSGGWSRVGGLHIRATQDGEFEYRINETQWTDVEHAFEFACLPLPDNLSSYDGVTVGVERIVLTRNGTVKQTFPDLDNIIETVAIVDYDHTGSDTGSFNQSAPEDRVDGLRVILGSASDDASWDMFVEQTENTEYLDCGSTTVGSNYASGGAGSNGAVKTISYLGSTVTPFINSTPEWNSITDEIDGLETDTDLQFSMLREQLYQRGRALYVQRGDIVPQVSTSTNNTAPIDILSVIHHNCSTSADVEEYLAPLRLNHIGGDCRYNVDAWLLGRERLSFTADEVKDDSKGDGGNTGGGGGGVAPNGGISAPIGAGSDEHQSDIDRARADTNGTDTLALKTFVGSSLTSHPASGSKLMVLGSNGVLSQLADGTSGQVLSTNGSGSFTFIDPPAGTSQTTTPTGAVDDDTPTQGSTVTWTATNYDGVTTYIPVLKLTSNGSTVLSGTSFTQNGAVVTFTHPSNTNTHTLSITAVSAGKSESSAWTDSITAVAHVSTWSYMRMQVVDTTSGNNVSKPIKVMEVSLFTGTGRSGTDNPTTNATGSNTNSSGLSDFVISHGYASTQGTAGWTAFDGSTTSGWSTSGIGRSQQDYNWCQIQFFSAKAIESARIIIDASNTTAPCDLKIMVSNTGAFSGEETTLTTLQDVGTGSGNITHDWTN